MRTKCACVLRVELINELIDKGEGLNPLGIHLLFDFIKDLVGLVLPVHAVTQITY